MLILSIVLPVSGNDNIDKTEMGERHIVDSQEVDPASGDVIDWWPMFHHDPEHTGLSTSTAPNTNNVLWTFTAKDEYSIRGSVVVDGRIYTGSLGVWLPYPCYTKNNFSGMVYCLDAETGDVIWQHFSRFGLQAEPAVVDGKVYVCSGLWYYNDSDNNVKYYMRGDAYCLDAEDGSLIWEYLDCGYVEGGPVVVDGKVYFGSRIYNYTGPVKTGAVYCLDALSGDEIWTRTYIAPRGSLAVAYGKVYVGLDNWGPDSTTEKFVCLNASTGETIWSWDEGNREEITAAPTVVEGKVYVATEGYGYITPDGEVYVPGEVHCFDAENGNLLWESDVNGIFYWCSPAVAYGNVYVGSGLNRGLQFRGNFYCLNATDGHLVWKRWGLFSVRGLLYVDPGCYSPAVADGKVYFGATDILSGNVYCLDAFTGKTIWAYKKYTVWGFCFQPAVADGNVYVGYEGFYDSNGYLFCFADIDSNAPDPPKISGPKSIKSGEEYEYIFVTNDPNGDDVYYYISWGDGTSEKWIGPYHSGEEVKVNHTWYEKEKYVIKARAKDINCLKGSLGSLKTSSISTNQQIGIPFIRFLELYPWTFPLSRKIVGLELVDR